MLDDNALYRVSEADASRARQASDSFPYLVIELCHTRVLEAGPDGHVHREEQVSLRPVYESLTVDKKVHLCIWHRVEILLVP